MENTVEKKLKSLWKLQSIHSEIDKIRQVRGELPIEVADLEDDIAGLETRLRKIRNELDELEDNIVKRKNMIKDAEEAIKKYEGQLNEVKNNREYDAITKEIEIQGLEIQVCEKRIKEYGFDITKKNELYEEAEKDLAYSKGELDDKNEELKTITSETQKDEEALLKKAKTAEKKIDARLDKVYKKLRSSYRNGVAVASIERESCSGCHNKIPPQVQSEIRQKKKIIICEHCGRILVDEEIAESK